MTKCRTCGAEIWWVGTIGWRRIAIDAVPCDRGDIRVERKGGHAIGFALRSVTDIAAARAAGVALHVVHTTTCRAPPKR